MKEVQINEKESLDFTILNQLKSGKNPSKISKELNISKQKIDYYMSKFKKKGLIIKKGYGVWEVQILPTRILSKEVKEIRGHAFIWIIKVPKEIRGIIKERAKQKGRQMNKGQIRLIIKDHKIWIGNKSIVIYENKSFYARNSLESRKYAVISMIEVLRALQSELGVSMKQYVFKPAKEHYGQIKNDLARQYNKKGEKLLIHDDLEGDWLWIDNSDSLGELEVSGKKAIIRSKQVQDWWNDAKSHNFEMTMSRELEIMHGIQQNQLIFADNMKSHIKAIQDLGNAVNKLTKKIEQTKLSDY